MTKETDKLLTEAEQKALDQMIAAVTNEQLVRADAGLPSRFGIQEAAVATGMSTSAIRRAIKAGKIEVTRHPITNAYEMSASSLIAAGYRLSSPKQEPAPSAPDNSAELDYLRQRIKDLEEALAYERQRTLSADERLDLALQALPRRLFSRKALKPGNPSA